MPDENKEAQYRTQRNAALKRNKVLETLLEQAGVDSGQVALAESLFSATEAKIVDGAVTEFTVNDAQKGVVKTIIGQQADGGKKVKEKEPDKGSDLDLSKPDDLKKFIADTVKEAVGGEQRTPAKTPAGTKPAQGGAGNGGMTRESAIQMSKDPALYKANREAIMNALKDGSLTTSAGS